jgi:WD40 repeat protein
VRNVAFGPAGSGLAASAGDDGVVVLFNYHTGRILRKLVLPDPLDRPTCIGFHQPAKALLVGSLDGVRAWDVGTGIVIRHFVTRSDGVNSAVISPDGRLMLTSSCDGIVRLWEWSTGRLITPFRGHGGIVCKAVFSPDGRKVASCSWDRTIRYWDLRTPADVGVVAAQETAVRDIAFSPDGQYIYSVCGGCNMKAFGRQHADTGLDSYSVREWHVSYGKVR